MAEYKLIMREVLRRLDIRDFDYYSNLSAEEQKAFVAPVVLRWLSTVEQDRPEAEAQLLLTNLHCNVDFFAIWEYPELQYKLMASSCFGYKLKHEWIPMQKRPKSYTDLFDFLLLLHPGANDLELHIVLRKYNRVDFERLLNDCGLPPKGIEEKLHAYDRLHGTETKRAKTKRS